MSSARRSPRKVLPKPPSTEEAESGSSSAPPPDQQPMVIKILPEPAKVIENRIINFDELIENRMINLDDHSYTNITPNTVIKALASKKILNQCGVCDKEFSNSVDLNNHMVSHHGMHQTSMEWNDKKIVIDNKMYPYVALPKITLPKGSKREREISHVSTSSSPTRVSKRAKKIVDYKVLARGDPLELDEEEIHIKEEPLKAEDDDDDDYEEFKSGNYEAVTMSDDDAETDDEEVGNEDDDIVDGSVDIKNVVEDDYTEFDKSLGRNRNALGGGRVKNVCAVRTCSNPQSSKYYTFPKNPALRRIWEQRTSRPNLFKEVKKPYICQRHFVKGDYLPDVMGTKSGKLITYRLDRNRAIPSRNLEKTFAPVKVMIQTESNPRADYDEDEEDLENTNTEEEVEDNIHQSVDKTKGRFTRVCAVKTCPNPRGLKYYGLPRNPTLRKIWVERTSRPNLLEQVKDVRICERHFVKEDFLPDTMSRRLTGKMVTKRLNKNCAIPSRNLGRKFDAIVMTVVPTSKQVTNKEPEPTVLNFKRHRCILPNCYGAKVANFSRMGSHTFPSEEKQPELRQKWIDFCLPDGLPKDPRDRILFTAASRLCTLHFTEDALHINPVTIRKKVKKNGFPTIFDVKPIAEQMVRDYLVENPEAIFNDEAESFLGKTSPVPNKGPLFIPILEPEVPKFGSRRHMMRIKDQPELLDQDKESPTKVIGPGPRGSSCAVKSCRNPRGLKYFKFPRDPTQREIWALSICRPNVFEEMKDPRICERHFVGGDYHPDAMINGNLNTKRLDKSKAIPSRNLGLNERMKNEMNNDQIMQDQGQSLMDYDTHEYQDDHNDICDEAVTFEYKDSKMVCVIASEKTLQNDKSNQSYWNRAAIPDNNRKAVNVKKEPTPVPSIECAVENCQNPELPLHPFPQDMQKIQKWFNANQKWKSVNFASARICSSHFAQTDFKTDIIMTKAGIEGRKELKPKAIPSQNLGNFNAAYEMKNARVVVKDIMQKDEGISTAVQTELPSQFEELLFKQLKTHYVCLITRNQLNGHPAMAALKRDVENLCYKRNIHKFVNEYYPR